jgi:predicted secreted hydrolase
MAGSDPKRYHVWIHDWSAALGADGRTQALKAATPDMAIDLALTPSKPPAINGENGVSQKAAGVGRASHYYSLTRLETTGTLRWKGEALKVAGLSWMDHEFGSNQLTPQQTGWDWYSIQLDNRRELMLYVLRLKDGGVEPMSSGTIVNPDGTTRHLKLADFQIRPTATWKSPHSGALYPAAWQIRVPSEQLDLRITPTVPDQELAPEATGVRYWEGSCKVTAYDHGTAIGGEAYVELTGYSGSAPGI